MSTRSAIITKTENGYRGIYCHFDGYLSGVGKTLKEHYKDVSKVKDLIDLGFISCLGEEIVPRGNNHSYEHPEKGVTIAYARDMGEEKIEAFCGKTAEEVSKKIGHNGYVYVFENGEWFCNGQKFECKEGVWFYEDGTMD